MKVAKLASFVLLALVGNPSHVLAQGGNAPGQPRSPQIDDTAVEWIRMADSPALFDIDLPISGFLEAETTEEDSSLGKRQRPRCIVPGYVLCPNRPGFCRPPGMTCCPTGPYWVDPSTGRCCPGGGIPDVRWWDMFNEKASDDDSDSINHHDNYNYNYHDKSDNINQEPMSYDNQQPNQNPSHSFNDIPREEDPNPGSADRRPDDGSLP
ncbi:uncharacterized protein BJX67DRAFT_382329 [Aspergillus lucknowensis]|uniref:Uncharacterized protein n=1 Tax=Aspergillus lucknowensis TaxID=176173 RepID=A0ABR4LN36_9EURO